MSESIPFIAPKIASVLASAGITAPAVIGVGGAALAGGLGLYWLFNSNNPDRMSSEKNQEEKPQKLQTKEIQEQKPWYSRAWDWTRDTGHLVGCCLQDWLSTQSPECAAFRQKAKNDKGIYAWFANLTSWSKGLLLGGVSLAVVIPLISLAFSRYATGSTTYVQPSVKPEIKPEIKPEFKPEFKNEIKPQIKPQINPTFNLDYEPEYEPDYNPNLLQNYVPTINVNTGKQQPPQIIIQPRGTVFVPYERGEKYSHKIKGPYDWLFE